MNGKVGELYRKWRPEGTYDAIVIGSGIGGLSVAALLAKHDGRRVLVLERHTTAGGFTHTFSRKGYEWDVGLHYIGQVGRGSMLRGLFDEVTDGALEWAPMGEVYDTVVIDGERWEYVAGRDAWRERMLEYFPDEKEAIDSYLDRVREAIGSSQGFFAEKAVPALVALLAGPWMRRRFLRHADRTVGEVLDGLTDNPTLKAVLCAQLGDYGLPPARASFAIHAMVFNHYLGGGSYPVGGSARIAEAVAPLIEAAGGQIVIGAEVSRSRTPAFPTPSFACCRRARRVEALCSQPWSTPHVRPPTSVSMPVSSTPTRSSVSGARICGSTRAPTRTATSTATSPIPRRPCRWSSSPSRRPRIPTSPAATQARPPSRSSAWHRTTGSGGGKAPTG